MSTLSGVWEASASTPFYPAIGKGSHIFVGFSLLLISLILTGLFGLNRSLISLPLYALPASLALGFGAVYTLCAAGVYV